MSSETIGYMSISGNKAHQLALQEGLEGFHRRCTGYIGREFIPKWDSTNAESVWASYNIFNGGI